jgi:hypothetical protein
VPPNPAGIIEIPRRTGGHGINVLKAINPKDGRGKGSLFRRGCLGYITVLVSQEIWIPRCQHLKIILGSIRQSQSLRDISLSGLELEFRIEILHQIKNRLTERHEWSLANEGLGEADRDRLIRDEAEADIRGRSGRHGILRHNGDASSDS